ncbi:MULTISPECIES: phosphate signaling complex protein PhoU [Limibacillus]|jgi:phosphate transport system protein|uniref:Phosphate-specific transport system accessory protein PhoU n=1 Tax=Limibacillus halophilus TaxID=1579333 RepID=A0A839SQ67_9PROT|nr:phosphate signaling complex protein PhoU [Limibacillus halophilus]MBB3064089.1 phosphate transport system protein [Limibacillus halophilus]
MGTGNEHKDHIVRSFDEQLDLLTQSIVRMGGIAESQLSLSIQALVRRDSDLAGKVVANDAELDRLEHQVDEMVVRLLALRQPMAIDLRDVISALKISSDAERIGDYIRNIAKRTLALNQLPPIKPLYAIPRMAQLVETSIKDVFDAYVERDVERAAEVWRRDEEVDEMYTSLFRELLTYMMEDPRSITTCTHLLFIAKNIERIGDHATNIAEVVTFLVTGKHLTEGRPKGDTTSYTVFTQDSQEAEGGNHDA